MGGGVCSNQKRNWQNHIFKHKSENGNEICPEQEMSFHGYELNINENVNRSTAAGRTSESSTKEKISGKWKNHCFEFIFWETEEQIQ